MKRWKKRLIKAAGLTLLVVVAGVAVLVVRSPVFAALTKSTEAFTPHPADARVRVEPGAQRFGEALAPYLGTATRRVEQHFGRPFPKPFEVLVCATQQSLNEFIAGPPGAPIRGTVVFGRVLIAPSAFDWHGVDTHRESLTHELAHLHLRQTLGTIAYLRDVPGWFHEAVSDLVAESGGEGIPHSEAVDAILNGRAMVPDSTGSLLHPRRSGSYGMPAPMLHQQATMFLAYVQASHGEAFARFLEDLQEERTFAAPFRRHFGVGVTEMWSRFAASLESEAGP